MSNKEKEQKKGGTPTKYHEELDEKAYEYLIEGKTLKELAAYLKVSYRTIYNWMDIHDSFLQSINRGRAKADQIVEDALFKRATGMKITEEQAFLDKRTGTVVVGEVTKELPPDVGAAKMWLHNRRPNDWKEKQEINVKGEGLTINVGYGKNEEEEEEE